MNGDFDIQQQILADQLRRYQGQTQTQAPQGRMAGRLYVAPNPLEYVAAGLRSVGGMAGEAQTQEQLQNLANERNKVQQQDMQAYIQALRGTPERQVQSMSPTVGNDPNNPQTITIPAVQGSPEAAYGVLAGSRIPQLRQAGMQGLAQLPELEARRAEREADRQARMQMLQDQIQARKELQAQSAADRRALAGVAAANKPEKMVTVVGAEGQPVTMPQSQASGMTPYNPTIAKQMKQQAEQGQARQQLSDAVNELRSYYDTLKTQGGIVSQDQGLVGNVAARIGSSGIGQTVGGAIGTKSQETRQKIEQTRPLLLNLIKNATGMSAQQMNSNAEMQLYLRAATDPTLSYEANQQALNNLDKMFGLGIGAGQPAVPSAPTAQGRVRKFNPATGKLE